jgi:hypothetical protein
VLYVNQEYTPAFWRVGELQHDLADLLRAHSGETPRYIRQGTGIIAMWGNLTIEPIDAVSRSLVAANHSPHVGILLATTGDLKAAITVGLPVYHIVSGQGFVWCANDAPGQGYLRFFAIDADALSVNVPVAAGEHEPNAFAATLPHELLATPPAPPVAPPPAPPTVPTPPPAPGNDYAHKHVQEWLFDARRLGPKYAEQSGTTWTLNKKQDEMTDLYDTTVESVQASDAVNVQARVVGKCLNQGHVQFTAQVADRTGRPTISFPDYKGRVRINMKDAMPRKFEVGAYSNELIIAEGSTTDPFPLAAIWRSLIEIETSVGPLLIKIPMYDQHVQEFVAACTSGER